MTEKFLILCIVTVGLCGPSRNCEISRVKRAEQSENEQEATHKHAWDYEKHGPQTWVQEYFGCGGARQSPINIDSNKLTLGDFSRLTFGNYDMEFKNLKIVNNGHSVQVDVDDSNPPYIVGGGLPSKYYLIQFHFHWSQKDYEGSETTIDRQQYPLELHLVHRKYGIADEEIQTASDYLAVLAVMFQTPALMGDKMGNKLPQELTDAINNVQNSGENAYVEKLRYKDLLPRDTSTFFRYEGSLTTPPCSQSVIWTVFEDIATVTDTQMKIFRQVKDRSGKILERNFRPVQGINARSVLYRSDSGILPQKPIDEDKTTSTLFIIFGVVICILLLILCIVLFILAKTRSKSEIYPDKNENGGAMSVAYSANANKY